MCSLVVPSKTLMVRNLAEETSEETLKSVFEGAIEARVTKDKETGISRGYVAKTCPFQITFLHSDVF